MQRVGGALCNYEKFFPEKTPPIKKQGGGVLVLSHPAHAAGNFCGEASSAAECRKKLTRRWTGSDQSWNALQVSYKRFGSVNRT